jgi:hypothetical protein
LVLGNRCGDGVDDAASSGEAGFDDFMAINIALINLTGDESGRN